MWSCCRWRCAVGLRARAKGEGATAGLEPGPPQDILPRKLVGHRLQSPLVLLHGVADRLQHLSVARLGLGRERSALRRVRGQVEHQGWVVVGDKASVAHADPNLIATSSSRRGKVGSEKMHLEDGITCVNRQMKRINNIIWDCKDTLLQKWSEAQVLFPSDI